MEGRRSGALLRRTLGHCAPHSLLCAGGPYLFIWQPSTEQGHFTALKDHSVNVKGPPCLATAASAAPSPPLRMPRAAGKAVDLQPGAVPSPLGAHPAPTTGTSVAGEGGSNGKSMMAPENKAGWGPLRFGTRRSSKSLTNRKISIPNGGSQLPRAPPGDHSSTGMGQATSMQRRTHQWGRQGDGAGPHWTNPFCPM